MAQGPITFDGLGLHVQFLSLRGIDYDNYHVFSLGVYDQPYLLFRIPGTIFRIAALPSYPAPQAARISQFLSYGLCEEPLVTSS